MTKHKILISELAGLWLASFFIFQACSSSVDKSQVFVAIADDYGSVSVEGAEALISRRSLNKLETDFQLYILGQTGELRSDQTAISGSYQADNGKLIFQPAFPFLKGKTYRAQFQLGKDLITRDFYIPNNNRPRVEVSEIYPSAGELPLNVLKFYIQFTDSMSRGFAYDNIHFVAADGDTLEDAYLELEEELWSPDMKRFTLLLDPGRIKRGLKSLEDLGYVFKHNQRYSLVVNKNWHDAHDMPMSNGFEKQFKTAGLYESYQGSLSLGRIPKAGTTDPVSLKSSYPNDYALLQRVIHIMDKQGNEMEGSIEITKNETLWKFTPVKSWTSENYQVRIESILEDVTGNNMTNPFDVDNQVRKTVTNGKRHHILTFKPR